MNESVCSASEDLASFGKQEHHSLPCDGLIDRRSMAHGRTARSLLLDKQSMKNIPCRNIQNSNDKEESLFYLAICKQAVHVKMRTSHRGGKKPRCFPFLFLSFLSSPINSISPSTLLTYNPHPAAPHPQPHYIPRYIFPQHSLA